MGMLLAHMTKLGNAGLCECLWVCIVLLQPSSIITQGHLDKAVMTSVVLDLTWQFQDTVRHYCFAQAVLEIDDFG